MSDSIYQLFEHAADLIEATDTSTGPSTPAKFSIQVFKQAYPTYWSSVLRELGVGDEKAFKYISSGNNGSAYFFGDREVVKFTADIEEAESMALLVGAKPKYLVEVYDVFWVFKGKLACVRQERLDKAEEDWKEFGDIATFYFAKILGQGGHPFDPLAVDQFKEWCKRRLGLQKPATQPEAATAEETTKVSRKAPMRPQKPRDVMFVKEVNPDRALDPEYVNPTAAMPTDEKFEWFRGLCEELTSFGIAFYDLNGGNIMMRGNTPVVIDLGMSDRRKNKSIKVIDPIEAMYRAMANRIEMILAETVPEELRGREALWQKLATRISHDPSKQIRQLGQGSNGTAYELHPQVVLKITKDKTEAEAMSKLLGKTMKHIVGVFDVCGLGADLYAITLERVDKPDSDWLAFFKATQAFFDHMEPVVPENAQRFAEQWKRQVTSHVVHADDDDWGDINPGDDVDLTNKDKPIPWPGPPDEEKMTWLMGLAEELQQLGIEFSDMNPGNVMKRKNGDHVVIDLGVSRVKAPEAIESI